MYNNVYQEYINNIIGSSPINTQSLGNTTNIGQYQGINMELERFYPELYKLIYPMIKTICIKNTKPLTEENLNEMVKEIYSNFVCDNATILNINLTNDVKSTSKNLETKKATTNKIASKESSKTMNIDDINEEDFSPNNYVLSDLIRILLIRELIGTSGNIIPTTSGFPPKRPDLFRTSDVRFDMQNYDIYEYMNI